MSVTNWVAESSNLIGLLILGVAVLVSSGALALDARKIPLYGQLKGVRFSGVTGLLLLAVAAVFAALGGDGGLWLAGVGGVLCLAVALLLELHTVHAIVDRTARGLARPEPEWSRSPLVIESVEAVRDVQLLAERVNELMHDTHRATETVSQLRRTVTQLLSSVEQATSVLEQKASPPEVMDYLAQVSIYTTASDGIMLKNVVIETLRAFDIDVAVEAPVELASWFQRFWVRAKESQSLKERMRKLEQAVELQYLGKARAEIDHANAQAVAALLQAVSGQENAVVRIGSLIVIKAQGDLAVWTVSALEAADMERHSALLRDPISALEYLRTLKLTAHQQPQEDRGSQGSGDDTDRQLG